MAEQDSTREKANGAEQIAAANPPRHSFIGIDRLIDRRAVRERKAREASEKHAISFNLYGSLAAVYLDVMFENPLSTLDVEPPIIVPPARIEEYDSLDGNDRRKAEENLRSTLESMTKRTLNILVADIKTANQDRGFEAGEASSFALQMISRKDKKHPSFWHSDRDAQIMLLEDLQEHRAACLVMNIDEYFRMLQVADVEDKVIKSRRERLNELEPEERASFSLRLRGEADRAIQLSFDVNLNRLAFLMKIQGVNDDSIRQQITDLRLAFERATLYDKAKLIARIQRKKETHALPHLWRLAHLRRVIEEEHVAQEEAEDEVRKEIKQPENNITFDEESQRLLLEDIMSDISSGLISLAADRGRNSLNELRIEDLQEEVVDLAKKYSDRSLAYTFHIWENLRRDPHDILEFKL